MKLPLAISPLGLAGLVRRGHAISIPPLLAGAWPLHSMAGFANDMQQQGDISSLILHYTALPLDGKLSVPVGQRQRPGYWTSLIRRGLSLQPLVFRSSPLERIGIDAAGTGVQVR